jgi:penicillin-binding protein 2
MSTYNQSRSRVIQIIFLIVFAVIIGQLVNLQIFSSKYRIMADNNAIYRKVIYPDRGIIFDTKKRAILENAVMFDLMVIPSDTKGIDKISFCELLEIDTAEYRKRITTAIIKNTSVKSSVFEPLLSPEMYARLNENIYKFPGFMLQERSIRSYPYNIAAAILGYIGEVDTAFLRKYKDEGYEMGDYTGLNGLERTYEKVLMGQRGIKRYIRDNKGRIQGSFEKGMFDTIAIAGRNLYTSIDIEVQQLAEKLLQNKIGSAVAINPKTGSIIAMATSPSYNPNSLTGSSRRKNFGRLLLDTARPLLNRAIKGQYPPGSTFKPLGGLVALDENLITPNYGFPCGGAYYNCGKAVRCTHSNAGHASNLRKAIAYSCNSYFVQVFRMAIDNPLYANPQQGYLKWKEYMNNFGMGVSLGIDLPGEAKASIPDITRYNKDFGGPRWNSCNILTLGIGQDRMTATPLQLSNLMCILANKGYYYTPHIVDSIENESVDDTIYLAKYRTKHLVTHIADSIYQIIQDGMEDVTIFGTAGRLKVPGHNYCAKTGTAQNPHGNDHAVFTAFAPKENPKIAVAVVVENSGYGGTWAGPVATLLMEKYLNDTLTIESEKRVESFSKIDLIPSAIKKWYHKKDSIRIAKEKEKEKEMEQRAEFENDTTASIKNTFDPEAEPNRKKSDNNNLPTIEQSPLILHSTEKKKKKDSLQP